MLISAYTVHSYHNVFAAVPRSKVKLVAKMLFQKMLQHNDLRTKLGSIFNKMF